ncbi:hypothetical protein AT746_17355 [Lacimicrobium alkaliphilum]|uniref:Uncharacterized protein n=1 Tax=Lacimicrobium alkaliphilum TaxID=1526571 RepID=A0A0U3AFR1_9ALTE|nr:hypothetical protein AT746_17355 [Lacimicrobium alkaliphilum]
MHRRLNEVSFLAVAREVTGSCYLNEPADSRFLVDCAMVQTGKMLRVLEAFYNGKSPESESMSE